LRIRDFDPLGGEIPFLFGRREKPFKVEFAMKSAIMGVLVLFFGMWIPTTASAQYFLFKQPRHGGFKIKPNDQFDFSNIQHFTGSGILATGFYHILQDRGMAHPKLLAGLLATGVGLLKEFEDGYREGFGMKDVLSNEFGIATFLLANKLTHFTVTVKQVISGPNDYGLGLRFFRTGEISPLKTTFGVYVVRDNHADTWVGLDSDVGLDKRLELHFGVSLLKLENSNFTSISPTFGFAYRLF